jgi:hypothetical protein
MKTDLELIWESYITEGKNRDRVILQKMERHESIKLADIKQYMKNKPHLELFDTDKGYKFKNNDTKQSCYTDRPHKKDAPLDRGAVKNIYQVFTGQHVTK